MGSRVEMADEIDRLWAENERLRKALEEMLSAFQAYRGHSLGESDGPLRARQHQQCAAEDRARQALEGKT